MSILSSLLRLGKPQVTSQVPTQIATTEIAKEVAPFIKDILGKGQALYKQRMEEGFVPFEGKTLADVTADQLAVQEGLRGLVGTQAAGIQEATELARGQTQQATAEALQPFMNPYQQAVTDIAKRKAQEKFEQETLPTLRKQAIDAGAFGGSRAAMRESQAQDAQARLLADIQAKGDLAAFTDARKAFEDQKTRERLAAEGISGLTGAQFQARKDELAGLQAIGSEEQKRQQQLLDESYQRFLQERQFPEQQLGTYQGFVQGASPFLGTTSRTMSEPTYQDSPIEKALGIAGTALGTYKTAKGLDLFSKEGGQVIPAEEGTPGGLRGIMIKIIRAQRGKGGDPRSRRSEEIRTREQQEDVTRMLEEMDMKAGGLVDLPVVQREEGQQVLNLRKPYNDPEFVSQGERIAEKVQNLPEAIKDFLGSIIGPEAGTERQKERREDLDQYTIDATGTRNRLARERDFARSGRPGLDEFKEQQDTYTTLRGILDDERPDDAQIPDKKEADTNNIVTKETQTTGGETTSDKTGDAPGVDKKGLPTMREALVKKEGLYSSLGEELKKRTEARLENIKSSKEAAKSQAQIDFLMGLGRGKRDPKDPSMFAGLVARGQEAVAATADFNDKIAALDNQELDVLDAAVQDRFNIESEKLNLAFKNGEITRQEFLDGLESRKVEAQERMAGINAASTSLQTIQSLLSDLDNQSINSDEFESLKQQYIREGIILPRHANLSAKDIGDLDKGDDSKLADTDPNRIVKGI
jgi:hypothetical protein